MIDDIRARGDDAVREYSRRFDGWDPEDFRLSPGQVRDIVGGLPSSVLDDIATVQANVRGFAQRQRESITDFEVETQPGVFLGQRNIPLDRAGATSPAAATRWSPRRT